MDLKNAQKKKSQFFNHSTLQNDAGSPEKKIPKSANFCKRADFTPKANLRTLEKPPPKYVRL